MASNSEHAESIIAAYTQLRRSTDCVFLTYGQLATLIGREGQHRLLAGPLDLVRELCKKRGLPDIATVVVSKDSLADGTLMPSPGALEKYNGWRGLREEQARVICWDWANHRRVRSSATESCWTSNSNRLMRCSAPYDTATLTLRTQSRTQTYAHPLLH
jgi:hypothetical protein